MALPAMLQQTSTMVVHNDFSRDANVELKKCKAFCGILWEDPLTTNANKCILIHKQAAICTFAKKYKRHVLSRCALLLSQNIDNPSLITDRIGEEKVLDEDKKKLMFDFL